jgi:hypothetical protein
MVGSIVRHGVQNAIVRHVVQNGPLSLRNTAERNTL